MKSPMCGLKRESIYSSRMPPPEECCDAELKELGAGLPKPKLGDGVDEVRLVFDPNPNEIEDPP